MQHTLKQPIFQKFQKKTPSKKLVVTNYNELKEKSTKFISSIKHNKINNNNGLLSLND